MAGDAFGTRQLQYERYYVGDPVRILPRTFLAYDRTDPGAEKILLFTETHPVLALESNGLRVLLRFGFGEEQKDYAASYRSARAALEGQLPNDCKKLIRAHQLLRLHGKELCKRAQPICEACPLRTRCHYASN